MGRLGVSADRGHASRSSGSSEGRGSVGPVGRGSQAKRGLVPGPTVRDRSSSVIGGAGAWSRAGGMYWQSGSLKKRSTLSVKSLSDLNSASRRRNSSSLVLKHF